MHPDDQQEFVFKLGNDVFPSLSEIGEINYVSDENTTCPPLSFRSDMASTITIDLKVSRKSRRLLRKMKRLSLRFQKCSKAYVEEVFGDITNGTASKKR